MTPSTACRFLLAFIILLFCSCKAEVDSQTSTSESTPTNTIVDLEEVKTEAKLAVRNAFGGNDAPLINEPSEATKKLTERNKMFVPEIIQLSDSVYVASGYTVSSNIMIIGDDGLIIIDPGQTVAASSKVREAFEKITDKPVKAIIYTHGHGDHINGTRAFYNEGQGIEIWARSNFNSEKARNQETGLTAGARPSNTQGFDLKPEQKLGVGIAIPPAKRPTASMMVDGGADTSSDSPTQLEAVPSPTHTFGDKRRFLIVSGVELQLVAAPGETDDQLYVWLPQQRILFAGDNFYQSWPNTYPLRGTARRSVRDWIDSLNKMIEEEPLIVVGGHTKPMENATEVLTNYRDGLKWVLDRTIKGIGQYLTPDELVGYAALPEHLANLDYLQDYYGSVAGTVRDIYAQDMGWFDGDPISLFREPPKTQAARMAHLLGSEYKILTQARILFQEGDYIGAALLAKHYSVLHPDNAQAWQIMGEAFAILGEQTFNAPTRNYTISSSNRFLEKANELAEKASE